MGQLPGTKEKAAMSDPAESWVLYVCPPFPLVPETAALDAVFANLEESSPSDGGEQGPGGRPGGSPPGF